MTTEATPLRCPNCGAAAGTDATVCGYCRTRLATVACPRCFAIMFAGMTTCPRCGATASRVEEGPAHDLPCPQCLVVMTKVLVGTMDVGECLSCGGIWLDAEQFQRVCNDSESQSAVIRWKTRPAPSLAPARADQVKYRACPRCRKLMNRLNFARVSGVIVDVCRDHGTWHDRDELHRVVTFIQGGGLERSRAIEREKLAAERRKLEAMQQVRARQSPGVVSSLAAHPPDESPADGALGALLRLFLT